MIDVVASKKINSLRSELLKYQSILKIIRSWAQYDLKSKSDCCKLKALNPTLVLELCDIVFTEEKEKYVQEPKNC